MLRGASQYRFIFFSNHTQWRAEVCVTTVEKEGGLDKDCIVLELLSPLAADDPESLTLPQSHSRRRAGSTGFVAPPPVISQRMNNWLRSRRISSFPRLEH